MRTDDRIRGHLEASASRLRAPDRLDEIMAEGRRRRIATRVGAVMAAAALLATVVLVASALDRDRIPAPVATESTTATTAVTTTPPTTGPTTSVPVTPVSRGDTVVGLIGSGPEGVVVVSPDGTTSSRLTSDPHYEAIDAAYPDLRGGLVVQHQITPLPWPQGAIVRLPAGADRPTVVVAPADGERIVPVGTGIDADGHATFVYRREASETATVVAVDLDDGSERTLVETGPYVEAAMGGNLVAVVDQSQTDCARLELVTVGGSSPPSPHECVPMGADVAVSGDGTSLAVLSESVLEVYAVDTGELTASHPLEQAYAVSGGSAGWAWTSEHRAGVVGGDAGGDAAGAVGGEAGFDLDSWGVTSLVPIDRPLDLAADASLGSGSGELPCSPVDVSLPDQELPEAVAETRNAIAAAAAACDHAALASMADEDGTVVSIGGGKGVDPIDHWVAEARLGDDPLIAMARLLTTTPATDPETGTWAWPAIAVDPAFDASWEELEPILGSEVVDQMRDGPGYLGRRIGITPDGRWMFATAGD